MVKTKHPSKKRLDLTNIIAATIRAADDSYFFENYTKQAQAVIRKLKKEGYVITLAEPTPKMVKAGINAINLGLVDAKELATRIFVDMYNVDE